MHSVLGDLKSNNKRDLEAERACHLLEELKSTPMEDKVDQDQEVVSQKIKFQMYLLFRDELMPILNNNLQEKEDNNSHLLDKSKFKNKKTLIP